MFIRNRFIKSCRFLNIKKSSIDLAALGNQVIFPQFVNLQEFFRRAGIIFPMLPFTILDDRTALQNMIEEMYPELPERKNKNKK